MIENTWKKSKALRSILTTFFLLILTLSLNVVKAQGRYELISSIPTQARLISIDQLGNVYLVVKNNVIKYDRNGNIINQYSNQRYGEISSIDATDPYKIVLFYEDFRLVIILDNQLSENGSPLDMQFTDFNQPILACRAYNTGIWTYDQLLNRLYRLTLSLDINQSTGNLTQILGYKIEPNFMIEYNNNLFMNNPKTGILVFDQFGTYTKTIAIKGLSTFQITEKAIYYTEDEQIKKYTFRKLTIESLPLPVNELQSINVDKNRLFILSKGSLHIYDYKE